MIQIVLRRLRRVIGMRMIEPEQIALHSRRVGFGLLVIRRPYQKSAPRALFRRVRQGRHVPYDTVAANQRAAAFVRIGLYSVPPNRLSDTRP
jgi:hypothetical protein